MLLNWAANASRNKTPITDSAIIALSRDMGALHGYNILDRLKYWRRSSMFGNFLWAFAAVDLTNVEAVKSAVNAFGGLDIGVNLPSAWQDSDVWDIGSGRGYRPGSWGGHSVPIVGYDENYLFVSTWGEIVPMTWAALPVFCDEGYALIDPTWLANGAVTPSNYDLETLHRDLKALQ